MNPSIGGKKNKEGGWIEESLDLFFLSNSSLSSIFVDFLCLFPFDKMKCTLVIT